MVDQNTFTETIREVAEIIRTSAEPMSREEILGYFKDMELNTEQENMVLEFLLTPHEEPEEEETEESKVDEAAEKEEEEAEAEDAQTGKNDEPEDILPDSPMFQMYLEELKDLPEAVIVVLAAVQKFIIKRDAMIEIVADGKIEEDEQAEWNEIMDRMNNLFVAMANMRFSKGGRRT